MAEFAGSVEMAQATPALIVEMMFGETAKAKRPDRRAIDRDGPPVLQVNGLARHGVFEDISFAVHKGEILGIAGLLGAGRTEVMRAIFGADPIDAGTVTLNGRTLTSAITKADESRLVWAIRPRTAKRWGWCKSCPLMTTYASPALVRSRPLALSPVRREQTYVDRQIADLAIKVSEPMLPVSSLSGGNQQKVVIGNWLNTSPKVMFFDEPSRGVDVQAKRQIFDIIWDQAERGLAAIFVSTELEEVLEVADRILVMRQGRIVAEVDPTTTDPGRTLPSVYGRTVLHDCCPCPKVGPKPRDAADQDLSDGVDPAGADRGSSVHSARIS